MGVVFPLYHRRILRLWHRNKQHQWTYFLSKNISNNLKEKEKEAEKQKQNKNGNLDSCDLDLLDCFYQPLQ